MQVPMRLIPRDEPARADAVVMFTDDAADVLRVAAAIGLDWPEVFRVAGGYVVVPVTPITVPVAGAIGLRRLAGSLFVPRDADLRPTLRADEALALTRTQGLVLLPQLTALAFDPESPLREAEFVTPPPTLRSVWGPLPTPPRLPRELTVIQAKLPQTPAAILEQGEPDGSAPVGTDPDAPVPEGARPPGASFFKGAAAAAQLAAGRALSAIGRTLGSKGLAGLGASLARSALEAVPRLTETILGKQEGALREILRQLERGNIEEALRRAPPAFADPDAPQGRVDGGSTLSERNSSYSLASLLGGGAAGVGWLGGGDVWGQLAAHYRKLAEDAVRRGDVRRAAYIHGVLLRDMRSAANALAGGGLHRDAAILYRDKLKDLPQAAREFEKAGDYDEALRLYLHLNQYEPAAELMRRLGDEERAVELFRKAAEAMAGAERYVPAGDLARDKVGDLNLAELYYFVGWNHVGAGQMLCAERMIELHAAGERWADLATLIDRAETRFVPPHTEEASRFFELVLRQEPAMPAGFRDDVRDQARLCLAGHLRDQAAAKNVVSQALGSRAGWSASLVRDAHVAVRSALAVRPQVVAKPVNAILSRLATGPVTAAVATPSGSVIVAGYQGAIQRYVSPTGGVETVQGAGAYKSAGEGVAIVALATDAEAEHVVDMTHLPERDYPVKLHSFWKVPGFGYRFGYCEGFLADTKLRDMYLEPSAEADGDHYAFVTDSSQRRAYSLPSLKRLMTQPLPDSGRQIYFVTQNESIIWKWDSGLLHYFHRDRDVTLCHTIPWVPGSSHEDALTQPSISWLTPELGTLEVAGVNPDGVACWSRLSCEQRTLTGQHARHVCVEGYAVACLIAPMQLVAVTETGRVVRLRWGGNSSLSGSETVAQVAHPSRAVFAAYQPAVSEVVIVFADGVMARVKI